MKAKTQTYYASLLGVHRSTINRAINGERNLSPELAKKVAKLAKTPIEIWLFNSAENIKKRKQSLYLSSTPES